jgi:hypothetical protein
VFEIEPDRLKSAVNADHLEQVVVDDAPDGANHQNLAPPQPLFDCFHSAQSPIIV